MVSVCGESESPWTLAAARAAVRYAACGSLPTGVLVRCLPPPLAVREPDSFAVTLIRIGFPLFGGLADKENVTPVGLPAQVVCRRFLEILFYPLPRGWGLMFFRRQKTPPVGGVLCLRCYDRKSDTEGSSQSSDHVSMPARLAASRRWRAR